MTDLASQFPVDNVGTGLRPVQAGQSTAFTRRLILCLLLVLATLALYKPVSRAPFLNYDDPVYVTDNPQVRAGLTWDTVVWTFRTPQTLDWHPMTWLSYELDSQIFGVNPEGYHTTNLLFHVANAVLLFLILESATGFAWRSFSVAVLFALAPINVESVAWIAERKNVLSMFFFLIALGAYGWYARRPGVGRYLAVTLAYVLSLMSKGQGITFPFALLLLDYWPLRRFVLAEDVRSDSASATGAGTPFLRLVAEKLPWFALSAVGAYVTAYTGRTAFSYVLLTNATELKYPLWVRVGNAAISYVKYVGKAFWPAHLALVYPHPGFGISKPAAVVSALAILAVTALAVIFRQRKFLFGKTFFVGWFWFLGTLVPMIGIVQIGAHAMADRYAYIPLLGIFVIVSWGAADLIQRWRIPTLVSATGAAAVLLMLGMALHRQVGYWGDNVTLWAHTLEVTGDNFTGEENLAMMLIAQNRAGEALPHLQRAHLLLPSDPLATLNLATFEQMLGNYGAALEGYAEVVHSMAGPSLLATARANSGYAHLSLKQYESAKRDFEAALDAQPANPAAYRGLGLVAQRSGNIAQAAQDYERAVELRPTPVDYLLLGHALEIAGQPEAARAAQSQATRMTGDLNDDIATVRQLLAN
jgi:protein O-mannosyl-transferase